MHIVVSRSKKEQKMKFCSGFLYIVQKGDTLYRLSRRYHVPLEAILQANPYMNLYNLQVGDEVCIPGKNPPQSVG